jgi:hypothetical protein
VCNISHLWQTPYCQDSLEQKSQDPAVGSPDNTCQHPFIGFLVFRAPLFSDASDHTEMLKQNLTVKLQSVPNKLFISNYYFDNNTYFWVQVMICPVDQSFFNRTEIINNFDLNSENYQLPDLFGPYYFTASPYLTSFSGICIL